MKVVTHWTVPADHPAFAGHFPGNPILPGVVLLDTVMRVVTAATGLAPDVCDIGSVKFRGTAKPGDELAIQHTVSDSGAIRFEIAAADRRIASGSIVPGSTA